MATDLFSRMVRVRQKFPVSPPLEVCAILQQEFARLRPRLKPGARIAVAVGSRGISNLQTIVATVLELVQAAGAQPFIVPAMGSHGGATAEGQMELLAEYGITETQLRVPFRAAMNVERPGTIADAVPVYFSAEALRADGILLINRVKPHTDFESDIMGSGLLKMLVVGLGKHEGAANFHAASIRLGQEQFIRAQARVVLQTAPVLCGVAIVENQRHQTTALTVLLPEEFERREAELFVEAKRLMPRLPFDDIDLLIVDRMGKNLSGTGMDPAVIGRSVHGYSAQLNRPPERRPHVRRLFVRDLTPESHGNGNGIGMADFTTARLVRALDLRKTYLNVLTSLSLNNAKIPMHFETDREAITQALASLALRDPRRAKVVRIRDTQSLEWLEASEAYTEVIQLDVNMERLGSLSSMAFGPDDNLLSWVGKPSDHAPALR